MDSAYIHDDAIRGKLRLAIDQIDRANSVEKVRVVIVGMMDSLFHGSERVELLSLDGQAGRPMRLVATDGAMEAEPEPDADSPAWIIDLEELAPVRRIPGGYRRYLPIFGPWEPDVRRSYWAYDSAERPTMPSTKLLHYASQFGNHCVARWQLLNRAENRLSQYNGFDLYNRLRRAMVETARFEPHAACPMPADVDGLIELIEHNWDDLSGKRQHIRLLREVLANEETRPVATAFFQRFAGYGDGRSVAEHFLMAMDSVLFDPRPRAISGDPHHNFAPFISTGSIIGNGNDSQNQTPGEHGENHALKFLIDKASDEAPDYSQKESFSSLQTSLQEAYWRLLLGEDPSDIKHEITKVLFSQSALGALYLWVEGCDQEHGDYLIACVSDSSSERKTRCLKSSITGASPREIPGVSFVFNNNQCIEYVAESNVLTSEEFFVNVEGNDLNIDPKLLTHKVYLPLRLSLSGYEGHKAYASLHASEPLLLTEADLVEVMRVLAFYADMVLAADV